MLKKIPFILACLIFAGCSSPSDFLTSVISDVGSLQQHSFSPTTPEEAYVLPTPTLPTTASENSDAPKKVKRIGANGLAPSFSIAPTISAIKAEFIGIKDAYKVGDNFKATLQITSTQPNLLVILKTSKAGVKNFTIDTYQLATSKSPEIHQTKDLTKIDLPSSYLTNDFFLTGVGQPWNDEGTYTYQAQVYDCTLPATYSCDVIEKALTSKDRKENYLKLVSTLNASADISKVVKISQ